MGERTGIEWTDHTFNPWRGCTKVSPGCDHCYAETRAKRFGEGHSWGGQRIRASAATLKQPLAWNRAAQRDGVRRRVFCASLADVFDNQVPEEWRLDLFDLIGATPCLDWLLLTKRPQNIARMLPPNWEPSQPWHNVWLGTTAENQDEADRRLPQLLGTPAVVRFLSCEPLIGRVDICKYLHIWWNQTQAEWVRENHPDIDWVICGGESGHNARPMHPDWARSLRDQCAAALVPFFHKQNGEYLAFSGAIAPDYVFPDGTKMHRVGKRVAAARLDGRKHRDFPE